jgi:hypothetical protein
MKNIVYPLYRLYIQKVGSFKNEINHFNDL